MITTRENVFDNTVLVKIDRVRLMQEVESGAIRVAIEMLGEEIYKTYRARIMSGIKHKHLVHAAKEAAMKVVEKTVSEKLRIDLAGSAKSK